MGLDAAGGRLAVAILGESQRLTPEQITLQIIAEIRRASPEKVRPESDLVADLGIDSPRALQLIVELEDQFGIEIEDEAVADSRMVGDVLEAVHRRLSA